MFFSNRRNLQAIIKKINSGDFMADETTLANERDVLIKEIKALQSKLGEGRENISGVIKDIFNIATMVSAFDLKLGFYSEQIRSMTGELNKMAETVYSAVEELQRQ